jgi:hypothetical protein
MDPGIIARQFEKGDKEDDRPRKGKKKTWGNT